MFPGDRYPDLTKALKRKRDRVDIPLLSELSSQYVRGHHVRIPLNILEYAAFGEVLMRGCGIEFASLGKCQRKKDRNDSFMCGTNVHICLSFREGNCQFSSFPVSQESMYQP